MCVVPGKILGHRLQSSIRAPFIHSQKDCQTILDVLNGVLTEINVKKSEKGFSPCQKAKAYGIMWDLKFQTAKIPADKFVEIMAALHILLVTKRATGEALEKLTGLC